MKLLPNWKAILRRAWSIRLALLAALFSGVEVTLPFFVDAFPRGFFAGMTFLVAVGATISRIIAQPGIRE